MRPNELKELKSEAENVFEVLYDQIGMNSTLKPLVEGCRHWYAEQQLDKGRDGIH